MMSMIDSDRHDRKDVEDYVHYFVQTPRRCIVSAAAHGPARPGDMLHSSYVGLSYRTNTMTLYVN